MQNQNSDEKENLNSKNDYNIVTYINLDKNRLELKWIFQNAEIRLKFRLWKSMGKSEKRRGNCHFSWRVDLLKNKRGSHDLPYLLPLKAGVCIMALGNYKPNIQ